MTLMINPFTATGIGSMPFADADYACRKSLASFPDAPFWPQLPRLGFQEDMVAQYVEGIPGVTIDFNDKVIRGELSGGAVDEMTAFYESFIAVSSGESWPAGFGAISESAARGLHAFKRLLKTQGKSLPFVKVQTTGPCTFALGVKTTDSTPIYYSADYRDIVIKALAVKSRWQIREFAPFASQILCFIDEPVLSAFGSSAYLGVKREDVVAAIAEVAESIRAEGALSAVHCCGNTEWTMLIDAGVDIINFDSYEYGDTMALYHGAMKKYLEAGGLFAWGAVPTSDAVRNESVESLELRLEEMIDLLASKGIDRDLIVSRALITPACGTGSILPADAEKVFSLVADLSRHMQSKYLDDGA